MDTLLDMESDQGLGNASLNRNDQVMLLSGDPASGFKELHTLLDMESDQGLGDASLNRNGQAMVLSGDPASGFNELDTLLDMESDQRLGNASLNRKDQVMLLSGESASGFNELDTSLDMESDQGLGNASLNRNHQVMLLSRDPANTTEQSISTEYSIPVSSAPPQHISYYLPPLSTQSNDQIQGSNYDIIHRCKTPYTPFETLEYQQSTPVAKPILSGYSNLCSSSSTQHPSYSMLPKSTESGNQIEFANNNNYGQTHDTNSQGMVYQQLAPVTGMI